MYKFEICAESAAGLERKILEAAQKIEISRMSEPIVGFASDITVDPKAIFGGTPPAQAPQDEVEEDEYVNEPSEEVVVQYVVSGPITEVKYDTEVDVTGTPWNELQHSANKTKNVDGSWKRRRTTKQAEVKAAPAFGSMTPDQYQEALQPVQTPPPPAPTVAVDIPFMPFTSVVTAPVAPVEPVVAPAPMIPQPGVVPAHSLHTFKNNLSLIFAHLINEKKIDQAYVQQLKDYFQVKEVWNISASEKQTTELFELFGKLGFITMVN